LVLAAQVSTLVKELTEVLSVIALVVSAAVVVFPDIIKLSAVKEVAPVPPFDTGTVGKSAATSERKAGALLSVDASEANTKFLF
jgi:hypothetical protein